MSKEKRQTLVGDGEHEIIFHHGAFVAMWCPKEAMEFPAELAEAPPCAGLGSQYQGPEGAV
jgi:hypothetical protein